MENLKFKVVAAPNAKSFDIIVTEPLTAPVVKPTLFLNIEDKKQPLLQKIELPAGFGHTVLEHTVTLDDISSQEIERFDDGVYWVYIFSDDGSEEPPRSDEYGFGFLAVITNLIRLQNLNLDHRHSTFSEIEDAHFNWMIYQCAVWATEIGQTRLFNEHVDHLKKLLPYMEEINENYDFTKKDK